MDRPQRRLARWLQCGVAVACLGLSGLALAQAADTSTTELTLYGLRLKDAPAEAFVAAASAAGAQLLSRQPDGPCFSTCALPACPRCSA